MGYCAEPSPTPIALGEHTLLARGKRTPVTGTHLWLCLAWSGYPYSSGKGHTLAATLVAGSAAEADGAELTYKLVGQERYFVSHGYVVHIQYGSPHFTGPIDITVDVTTSDAG